MSTYRKGGGWNWIFLTLNLCALAYFAMTGGIAGVLFNAAIVVLHVHNIVESYR